MVLYNNKKLLAALGGYQRHDGHYVCNLHSVPCTSPGLATVVAKVSREKKRVILKRKLNLLHVEYEENSKRFTRRRSFMPASCCRCATAERMRLCVFSVATAP
ncbi:hypothetical protein PPROV_000642800 [Pycnococcus provasolii]|uniref:Uncharacterized protein n=1 Tax=Pycnococcus provasolii TaxID=41880 RepID=A0A830HJY7_9CHLO|nr:hypothetical protein PPROV_000642800 [Pycnococcus provasolii]|mmetsp:Transcript_2443/g.5386  ORF Transcript_2443/g.5386 Transcript_2443/m.5386 type:complete len:103 (-) Transcript_2443:22-330(-)